ncbi:MAG: acyl carrier protein [Prochlorothrix sp.]
MSATIIEKLKTIIVNELDTNLSVDEIDESTSLFEDGLGFDSIATVELISLVEKHFDIEFSDAELNPENFGNLKVLAGFIEGKQ